MDKRKILKKEKIEYEDYWICERCEITSDTPDRMIPCPRGGCDAELVGEKEIKTTIYELEAKLCDCGKGAKWLYMPGFSNGSNPFVCHDCIGRGCDHCSSANKRTIFGDYAELPTGIEGYNWKWVKKNNTWTTLDKGREWPCSEYEYDSQENNFKTF